MKWVNLGRSEFVKTGRGVMAVLRPCEARMLRPRVVRLGVHRTSVDRNVCWRSHLPMTRLR